MQTKAFPWVCPACRNRTVYPATVDYLRTLEHDGQTYEVGVPLLDVPQCRDCNKLVMVNAASQRITDALRQAAGLLPPEEIRRLREANQLTQRELADYLQVAVETVSRWESGAQLQQRSMDRWMRMFFKIPGIRHCLDQQAPTDSAKPQFGEIPGSSRIDQPV